MSAKEFPTVRVEEAPEGATPRCPGCKERLGTLWIMKRGLGLMEQKQIIMCPHCEMLIGYGVFGGR